MSNIFESFISDKVIKTLIHGNNYNCPSDMYAKIFYYLSKCSFKKMNAIVKIQRWFKKHNGYFIHNIVSIFGKKICTKIRQTETIKSIKKKLFLMNFFDKPDITIDNYSNKIRIIICGNVISDDIVLWNVQESYDIDKILNLNCIHAVYVRD